MTFNDKNSKKAVDEFVLLVSRAKLVALSNNLHYHFRDKGW